MYPSNPECFSTYRREGLVWLMGRWPTTSPLNRKSYPLSFMTPPAMLNIRAWQSMQGFMCWPYPQGGFLSMGTYRPVMFFTVRGIFRASAARTAFAALKKGVSKQTQWTSMPWSRSTRAASMLSSPPEHRPRARTFCLSSTIILFTKIEFKNAVVRAAITILG